MKNEIPALFLLVGCTGAVNLPAERVTGREATTPNSWAGSIEELKRARESVVFSDVHSPATDGFLKHWTLGSRSAWFSMGRNEVLVVDASDDTGLRISGFLPDHGLVGATGWEDNAKFFVHLSRGADSGTMMYLDLNTKTVMNIEHWAAW
jgi:hypothetical protein